MRKEGGEPAVGSALYLCFPRRNNELAYQGVGQEAIGQCEWGSGHGLSPAIPTINTSRCFHMQPYVLLVRPTRSLGGGCKTPAAMPDTGFFHARRRTTWAVPANHCLWEPSSKLSLDDPFHTESGLQLPRRLPWRKPALKWPRSISAIVGAADQVRRSSQPFVPGIPGSGKSAKPQLCLQRTRPRTAAVRITRVLDCG